MENSAQVFKQIVDQFDQHSPEQRSTIVNSLLKSKYATLAIDATNDEIASILGISKDALKQAENSAIKKLKVPTLGKPIREAVTAHSEGLEPTDTHF